MNMEDEIMEFGTALLEGCLYVLGEPYRQSSITGPAALFILRDNPMGLALTIAHVLVLELHPAAAHCAPITIHTLSLHPLLSLRSRSPSSPLSTSYFITLIALAIREIFRNTLDKLRKSKPATMAKLYRILTIDIATCPIKMGYA